MRLGPIAGVIVALLIALAPASALAAETRGGGTVTIGAGQIINDDLYISGGTVTVLGRINGDLVASGGNLTVRGPVAGDVIIAGGTVDLDGPVGGSVRAAAGNVNVRGRVAKDVLGAGGTITIGPGASVGRDLLTWGGTTLVQGPVMRNVRVSGGQLTLASPVGGSVTANVDTLRLADGARVGGNLVYTSKNPATLAPGASVRGKITHNQPPTVAPPSPAARIGAGIVGWIRTLVGLFVLGILLVLLVPRFSTRTINTLEGAPWASLGLGFALLVGVPVLAVLVFALGLLIGGWWIALVLLALYGIALALGYVVSGLTIGCWLAHRLGRTGASLIGALLAGLVILLLVGLVPILGGIVELLALIVGLGALTLTLGRLVRGRSVAAML